MLTYRDGGNIIIIIIIMDIECDDLADRSEDYETLQQATFMPTPVKSAGDIELVTTHLSYGKHNGV